MKHNSVSWNASADVGFMDTVLSRPEPKRWLYSQVAKSIWQFIDFLEEIGLFFEPRNTHVNERILEIPFVLQRLPKTGRLLDVGSSSSLLALQLASLGYDVTAVDVRSYPFQHQNLKFVQDDIKSASLEKNFYDCAIIISTIEHVGLGGYGDTHELSDRDFLNIVSSYVRPQGTVFLTMPFGKSFKGSWYRVYGSTELSRLLDGFTVLEKKFAKRVSFCEWQICNENELNFVASENHPMNGLALICLSVP